MSRLVQLASPQLIELEGHKETVAAYIEHGLSRQEAIMHEALYASYVAIDRAQFLAKGKILCEARDKAEAGTWNEVILPRYGLTERTAQNLMNAWRKFGSDPSSISRLKPSAVYLLAAPEAPHEFVEEIIAESKNGHDFTVSEIKERRKGLMVQPPRSVGESSIDYDDHFDSGERRGTNRLLRNQAVGLVLASLIQIVAEEGGINSDPVPEWDEHAQRNAKSLATRVYGMMLTDPSLAIIQRHLQVGTTEE